MWCDVKTVRPFIPNIHMEVYDGDTITIATPLYVYKFNVRILGIDTAELKTNGVVEPSERYFARDALSNLILHKVVKLKNVSYEVQDWSRIWISRTTKQIVKEQERSLLIPLLFTIKRCSSPSSMKPGKNATIGIKLISPWTKRRSTKYSMIYRPLQF